MAAKADIKDCSFLCSWSGGKDSYFACFEAVENEGVPAVFLNVLNENGAISRSHAIPREVLIAQAELASVPIEFIASTWTDYEANYIQKLKSLQADYQFTHSVFGDIDIESHRAWEEKVSKAAGLIPELPLWQRGRRELVKEMLDTGIEALIVSCQAHLAEAILGKTIDQDLIQVFDGLGIDACGENGEYHTIVVDGPLNKARLDLEIKGQEQHNQYAFLDFQLAT